MEPIGTFLTTALGYILKGAAQSKAATAVREELLGRFWQWIRPRFIRNLPQVEESPDAPKTETEAKSVLLELIKDETFFNELGKRVAELQKARIKAKNIVHGDIKRVKKIKIGDKEYSPNDSFNFKNIVNGNVEGADEFFLGDGH